MAGQRCPRCRWSFQVLDDEVGMHACPSCGYHPSDESEESEDDAIEREIRDTEQAVEDGQARWSETGSTRKR